MRGEQPETESGKPAPRVAHQLCDPAGLQVEQPGPRLDHQLGGDNCPPGDETLDWQD